MARTFFRKLMVATAWGLGLLFVLLTALHLLLPYLINTDAVKTRIIERASRATGGEFELQRMRPALLPIPHAVLTQSRVSVPGKYRIAAAEIGVYPRISALLSGRLTIDHLKVIDPAIELHLPAPPPARIPADQHPRKTGLKDRFAGVLAVLAPLVGNMELILDGGRLDLLREGEPLFALEQIDLKALAEDQWLRFELKGRSDRTEKMVLGGNFNLATLDGTGRVRLYGLQTGKAASLDLFPGAQGIPEMTLDADIRLETRALETLEAHISADAPTILLKRKGRRLPLRGFALQGRVHWIPGQLEASIAQLDTDMPAMQLKGTLKWTGIKSPAPEPIRVTLQGTDLDLGQVRKSLLQMVGDITGVREVCDIVRHATIPQMTATLAGDTWAQLVELDNMRIEATVRDGRLVIPDALLDLKSVSGRIEITDSELRGENASARLGNITAANGFLAMDLSPGSDAFHLETDVDADLSQLPVILAKLAESPSVKDRLGDLPPVAGRAAGRFVLGDHLDRLSADLDFNGDLRMLDAHISFSGPVTGFPAADTRTRQSIAGNLGPRAMAWFYHIADLPSEHLPVGPLSVVNADIIREASSRLVLKGDLELEKSVKLSASLGLGIEEIKLETLHIRDSMSDARIGLAHRPSDSIWEGRFRGQLHKATLDKLWPGNDLLSGWIQGDLKARVDTAAPTRSIFQGQLKAADVNLPVPDKAPISILAADITGTGNRIAISSADVTWQEQNARLSGQGELDGQDVNIDLKLESPDMDVDKLMAAFSFGDTPPPPDTDQPPEADKINVHGHVALAIEKLHYGGFPFKALKGEVWLTEEQTRVTLADANLCGIAVPGVITIDDSGMQMAFDANAKQSPLSDTGDCLALVGITERLDGKLNLDGHISTQGKDEDALIKNLTGNIKVRMAKGKIHNVGTVGFFTNLFSYLSVNQLVAGGMPDLRKNDFHYNRFDSDLALKDGDLLFEELIMKSNSINIVGKGRRGLSDNKTDLVLLVSPLTTVDWIIEHTPIVGHIFQGTLLAIPMGVKGQAGNPTVIPLTPKSIGARLGGILKRTVQTPFRIIAPILPGKAPEEKKLTETDGSDGKNDRRE